MQSARRLTRVGGTSLSATYRSCAISYLERPEICVVPSRKTAPRCRSSLEMAVKRRSTSSRASCHRDRRASSLVGENQSARSSYQKLRRTSSRRCSSRKSTGIDSSDTTNMVLKKIVKTWTPSNTGYYCRRRTKKQNHQQHREGHRAAPRWNHADQKKMHHQNGKRRVYKCVDCNAPTNFRFKLNEQEEREKVLFGYAKDAQSEEECARKQQFSEKITFRVRVDSTRMSSSEITNYRMFIESSETPTSGTLRGYGRVKH